MGPVSRLPMRRRQGGYGSDLLVVAVRITVVVRGIESAGALSFPPPVPDHRGDHDRYHQDDE